MAIITVFWTLYAYWSNYNLDRFIDMLENYALGRRWALGYPKHPPLSQWTTAAWFSVLPTGDFAYRALTALNLATGLGLMAALARRFLDPAQQMAALAVSLAIPLMSFLAMTYNANSAMIPYWAGAALAYFGVIERRSMVAATALGLCIGLALLSKYYSAVLVLSLLAHSLFDREVRPLWRTGLPWIAMAVATAVFAPHAVWLGQNGFGPVTYAALEQGDRSLGGVVGSNLAFIASQFAYALPGLAPLALYRRRGDNLALFDFRSVLALDDRPLGRDWLFLTRGPPRATIVLSLAMASPVTTTWSMPAAMFWPVLLTLLLQREIANRRARTGMAFIISFAVVLLALSPVIQRALLREAGVNSAVPVRRMVAAAESAWAQAAGAPLDFVTGENFLAYGASFYAGGNPLAVKPAEVEGDDPIGNAFRRSGVLAMCRSEKCLSAEWLAANGFRMLPTIVVPGEPGAGGPASYPVHLWVKTPAP
ncbi:MAG: glycosyltransferase family 39 protein [Phyllobacteriaceae bacterium]|nr:glycosyltransferase family 39 protein [Phyllobacteriaceae bacterium]